MKHSIKRFLLTYLLITITGLSFLMISGNYILDTYVIRRHFDSHLEQVYSFLNAVVTANPSQGYLDSLQQNIDAISSIEYKKKKPPASKLSHIKFKVWDDGRVLLQAKTLPPEINHLHFSPGFTTIKIRRSPWRVFMTYSKTKQHIAILVTEKFSLRNELVDDLAWNNILILLWSYPLFALLIWLSIDRGLLSLKRITDDIVNRRAERLDLVDATHAPLEIKPLVGALNRLFERLDQTFKRNQRFSSDAAHELRTPLAALKTQAQVALKSTEEDDRLNSLRNVIIGVDRCTHIVQQLLTLSRLDPESGLPDVYLFNLSNLTAEIIAQLVPSALEKNIDVSLEQNKENIHLYGNEIFLAILIRNLVDNAIRYTPDGGEVHVYLTQNQNETEIRVTDTGPGIPPELQQRVFERFYRVLGNQASGSGLGLAIVQQIAELHGASISLHSHQDKHGLDISVTFKNHS